MEVTGGATGRRTASSPTRAWRRRRFGSRVATLGRGSRAEKGRLGLVPWVERAPPRLGQAPVRDARAGRPQSTVKQQPSGDRPPLSTAMVRTASAASAIFGIKSHHGDHRHKTSGLPWNWIQRTADSAWIGSDLRLMDRETLHGGTRLYVHIMK